MALQKQQLARASSSSSSSSKKSTTNVSGSYDVSSDVVSSNQQDSENQSLRKLYDNLVKANPSNNLSKQIYRNLIYGEVQNGHITESDASALFDEFNL